MSTLQQSIARPRVYERDYPSYSFDVQQVRTTRVQRHRAELNAKDRGRILILMVVAGIIALGIIVATAYGASINYVNNQLRDANAALQSEVDTLEIQLQSANNVAEIQDKAMKDLGMVYAEGKGFVDLSRAKEAPENLSVVLKKNAYK